MYLNKIMTALALSLPLLCSFYSSTSQAQENIIEIIKVYATPLQTSTIESALPVNVISSEELRLKQAATLGETLKNELGIHSTYYGPVASSPIIRGLGGPRVLVTQNGLDVGDASRVSPDHVVVAETSTAMQIEVLRGPATLFYGSGAIGGVVNVVDTRVPTSTDTFADWLIQYNSIANENQASINLQSGMGQLAWHFDSFWRESDDYTIAGEAELDGGHENNHAQQSNILENSASQSNGFTLGSSYLLSNGYIGFSYGLTNRTYGLPGSGHHDDVHLLTNDAEESVYAEMKQHRFQLLSELTFTEHFINKVNSKWALTDYQHQEIEDGVLGTQFTNDSLEARFDFYHQPVADFTGAWTLHYKKSDFSAVGEEAFTPASTTKMMAAAWLEERHFGDVSLQLGIRVEQVTIAATPSELPERHNPEVNFEQQVFSPLSTSVGLVWTFKSGYNVGFSFGYSQRAPSASELFSNGAHLGTSTFELGAFYDITDNIDGSYDIMLGDQDVAVESSTSLDLTLRKFTGDVGFVFSVFYNQVNDFYYQQATDLAFIDGQFLANESLDAHQQEEALPVMIFRQEDVAMYGAEAEFIMHISEPFKVSLLTDYIRAKLKSGGDLPRIPPMRLGLVLDYQADNFASQLSISRYFEQTNLSERETTTEGYIMVDANLNYYLDSGFMTDMVLFVKGENLTNVNARVHSSFLKEVAPLPGRGISIGIRGSF